MPRPMGKKLFRDPPDRDFSPEIDELTHEPFYEDWNGFEEPCITAN